MKNKQTAVKWLWQWIMKNPLGSFDDGVKAYNQAKKMEKEQIKDAFTDGCIGEMYELNAYYTSEKYYNETYGQ